MNPFTRHMALVGTLCAVVMAGDARADAMKPATVADAAKVLDLASFPLMDGVKIDGPRRLASLGYPVKGDPRSAYAFQKKTLEAKGWKERKGGYLSDMTCSGVFGKAGYLVSVSTSPAYGPEAAGMVQVQLTNHGNVDVSKLPVPAEAKPLYSFPVSTAFVTETPAEETGKALRKRLMEAGWEPYGTAGDTQFFKQNAVRISVTSVKAPAQGGKTVIQLSSELLSADLPAPPETLSASYSDTTKALAIDVAMTNEQLVSFYKETLGKAGWTPTTERLIKDGFEEMMIFGNPAKEILTLKMHSIDGKLRANLDHMTAAEFAEVIRLAKAAEDKLKADTARYAKRAAEEAARNRVIASIEVPREAKDVKRSKDEVVFKLASGIGRDAARALRDDLRNQGWKEDSATLEPLAGTVVLHKKSGTLTIVYVDTGIDDANVTLSTIDADIDAPDAK